MRKFRTAVCATLLAVLMSTSFVFADGLKLVGSYPENGQHDLQPMNVAVKLRFNHNMVGKEAQKANKGKIRLLDKKGKTIKIMTLYSEKNPKEIWVYVQKDLKSKGKYKLEISKNLQATDGQTLGENTTVKFGIMDMQKSTNIYILMMVLMVVFMVVFTSIGTKRKAKKEAEEEKKKGKVNPYKVAKETGKSVEAVVSADREQKQKQAEKKNKQKQKIDREKAERKEAKEKKYEQERKRNDEIKRRNDEAAKAEKDSKKRKKKQDEKERIFISESKKAGKPRVIKYNRQHNVNEER